VLTVRPITLRAANSFVLQHHSHHPPVRGCVFCVACYDDERLCGVAIVGRPVSRMLDDGLTFELTRVCTDRTRHAASKLVAAATRAARAIGYTRGVSYVLEHESGTSYRAAGWTDAGQAGGGSWHRNARPREDLFTRVGFERAPTAPKRRWEWRAAREARS
jgi:hypothetical protein